MLLPLHNHHVTHLWGHFAFSFASSSVHRPGSSRAYWSSERTPASLPTREESFSLRYPGLPVPLRGQGRRPVLRCRDAHRQRGHTPRLRQWHPHHPRPHGLTRPALEIGPPPRHPFVAVAICERAAGVRFGALLGGAPGRAAYLQSVDGVAWGILPRATNAGAPTEPSARLARACSPPGSAPCHP